MKTSLPAPPSATTGIVNVDDPSAGVFIGVTRETGARVITYGTEPAADVRATRIAEDASGLHAKIVGAAGAVGDATIDLRLVGRFNVHNALAVVALGEALGRPAERVQIVTLATLAEAAVRRDPAQPVVIAVGEVFRAPAQAAEQQAEAA